MASTDSAPLAASNDQEPIPMSRESSDQPITQPWPVPPPSPIDPASPKDDSKDRIIKTDEDYGSIDGVENDADVSGIEDEKTDPYVDDDDYYKSKGYRIVTASETGSAGQGAEARVRKGVSYKPHVLSVTAFPNDPELKDSFEFKIPCTKCGLPIFYLRPKSECHIHNGVPCALANFISDCPYHKGHAFGPSLLNWIDSGSKIICDDVEAATKHIKIGAAGGGAADTGVEAVFEQEDISGTERSEGDIEQSEDDDEEPEFKSPSILTVQVQDVKFNPLKKHYTVDYFCPLCRNSHFIGIKETVGFNPKSVPFVAGPPPSFDHICNCSPRKQPMTVNVSFKVWQFLGCKIIEAPADTLAATQSRKRCRQEEEEELLPVRGC
jgi:hypothetical protein